MAASKTDDEDEALLALDETDEADDRATDKAGEVDEADGGVGDWTEATG